MPITSDDVRFRGKTGSRGTMVKTTRMTRKRHFGRRSISLLLSCRKVDYLALCYQKSLDKIRILGPISRSCNDMISEFEVRIGRNPTWRPIR